jgi:pilus assembly protein CpaB
MAEKKKAEESSVGGGTRALAFLVLALVAGAAATILIYQVIQSYQARIAEARKPEATQMVIIASGELFPGLQITENDIIGIQVPVKLVPKESFSAPELVVGAIPRERILPNEFILPGRLADADSGIGLNALVPAGMRAVSINLADDRALSGFLVPGNRVDVLVSIQDAESQKLETLTALQTVPVLAVNNQMFKNEKQKREEAAAAAKDGKPPDKKKARRLNSSPSVTLAVTPEQAEILVHALQIGRITLALRSDGDIEQSTSMGIDTTTLLGENEPPPELPKPGPKPKAKPKAVVEAPPGVTLAIIRGGVVSERKYDAQGNAIK